ncbi:MAG: hypothetical protein ACYS0G_16425 [Planctomycetota bacterium]|jgi:hypothetical protein
MRWARLRAAILVIALNTPGLGAGGAVCLDALSWLPADCPDPCCNTPDACCPDDSQPAPRRVPTPAPPDCCVGAPDLWYHANRSVNVAAPAPTMVVNFLATGQAPRRPYLNASNSPEMRRPPPIPLVGVVLLQV